MSIFIHEDGVCPSCEGPCTIVHDTETRLLEHYCLDPLCENSSDTPENQLARFLERVRRDDFAVGDSFWIGQFEFEVVSRDPDNITQPVVGKQIV